MICVLKVLRGPATRSRYVLRENQHVEIGRSTKADISLPSDSHLSRRHVLVDSFGDGFSICDLGSVNGTFLNDERVKRAALKNGDVIRIGMTQFRVTMMDDDANPHAEDGILFSSSVSHGLDSKGTPLERSERSLSFPNTLLAEDITRCVPRSEIESAKVSVPGKSSQSVAVDDSVASRGEFAPEDPRIDSQAPAVASQSVSRFFSPSEHPNLYKFQQQLESPWGEFVGLLMCRSDKDRLLSIFNTTQVRSDEAALLEQKLRDNRLVSISKTILAGHLSVSQDDLSLLSACTRCDGLICVGSEQQIDPDEIKVYANSFSYPSLFGEHMKDLQSPLRKFLLIRRAWVLFEWSRNGPIGLFA
jgi:hypothetical protein